MIVANKLLEWYIVSYGNLHSNLVAGKRSTMLHYFLKNKGINTKLITTKNPFNDPDILPVSNKESNLKLVSKLLSLISPVDYTLIWSLKVIKILKKSKGRILITNAPPYGISIIGILLIKKRQDFYWIADFEDPWTISKTYKPKFYSYKMFFANYFEKKLFNQADLILLNTHTDCVNYVKKYPFAKEKCLTIRNGFDYMIPNAHCAKDNKVITLVYAGGLYNGDVAISISKLLEKLNKIKEVFHCNYYGEYHEEIDKSKYSTYKGAISHDEVPKILSTYKVGFIYQQPGDMAGGRINQKFYEYIATGVHPVVINPSPEIKKHLNILKVGLTIEPNFSPEEISSQIKRIYTSDTKIQEKLLKKYSREYQFEVLYTHLQERKII